MTGEGHRTISPNLNPTPKACITSFTTFYEKLPKLLPLPQNKDQ